MTLSPTITAEPPAWLDICHAMIDVNSTHSFAFMAAANGAIYPIVVNNALQTFKDDAAKAAGLQNFIQISVAFGASSIVAAFAGAGEQAIGLGILICSVIVFGAYYTSRHVTWKSLQNSFTMPDPARIAIKQSKD